MTIIPDPAASLAWLLDQQTENGREQLEKQGFNNIVHVHLLTAVLATGSVRFTGAVNPIYSGPPLLKDTL